jgi:hypothetical protein
MCTVSDLTEDFNIVVAIVPLNVLNEKWHVVWEH